MPSIAKILLISLISMDCVRCGETFKAVQNAESKLAEAQAAAKRVEKENKEVQRKNTELYRRLLTLKARVMALEAKASFTGLARDGAKAIGAAGRSAYNAGGAAARATGRALTKGASLIKGGTRGLYDKVRGKSSSKKGVEKTDEEEVFSI